MTWVASAVDGRFGVENLPYGIYSTRDNATPRLGARIGDEVLDLRGVAEAGQCANCPPCSALRAPTPNPSVARGRGVRTTGRGQPRPAPPGAEMERPRGRLPPPLPEVRMPPPFHVAD